MLPYIKLFGDLSATVDLLSDAEAGRLLKSLLHYVNDQEDDLPGQEKLVFAMIRSQIDRDAASYREFIDKQRENGKRGGRPKGNTKPTGFSENPLVFSENPENPLVFSENPENPLVFSKTQKSQEEDKEKEKEEDEDIYKAAASKPIAFADDEELRRIQDDHNEIFDALKNAGFIVGNTLMQKAVSLYEEHGKEKVLYAIDQCVEGGSNSLHYLKAVIENFGKPKKRRDDDDDDGLEKYEGWA